jgi:hypothetical protein
MSHLEFRLIEAEFGLHIHSQKRIAASHTFLHNIRQPTLHTLDLLTLHRATLLLLGLRADFLRNFHRQYLVIEEPPFPNDAPTG